MNVLEQRQAEAVVSIAKTLRSPDWEQRRYEIARDTLGAIYAKYFPIADDRTCIKIAVECADILIAELKKGGEK